ncbi:ATP-dependent DNA/RNA helicase dhx36 [Bulinus truncatus]|nr:ATP-dependent DNA/RNA helicase dhx36 [Bulinus truncatus]
MKLTFLENLALIKAVLCAGFYPNVAEIVKVPNVKSSQYKTVSMLIKDHTKVMAHPKSVNSRQTYFDSVWMVYYYKLKTKKVYIHDSTMVSPYPLLFFGGNIKITKDKGQELVCVDDWIKFKASSSTAQLVKDLRCELDKLLSNKITHPGPTVWDNADSEGAIMNAIIDLIAGEEKGYARFGGQLGGSIGKKS